MPLKVEHTERADITQTIHVDSELAKEVDGLWRTSRQGVPKNERRSDDGKQLRKERGDFHLEELAELGMYLLLLSAWYRRVDLEHLPQRNAVCLAIHLAANAYARQCPASASPDP